MAQRVLLLNDDCRHGGSRRAKRRRLSDRGFGRGFESRMDSQKDQGVTITSFAAQGVQGALASVLSVAQSGWEGISQSDGYTEGEGGSS